MPKPSDHSKWTHMFSDDILSNEHTAWEWLTKEDFLEGDQHWFLRELVERI